MSNRLFEYEGNPEWENQITAGLSLLAAFAERDSDEARAARKEAIMKELKELGVLDE